MKGARRSPRCQDKHSLHKHFRFELSKVRLDGDPSISRSPELECVAT
ncbi:unnamed protein product [Menidia menidia]|uniref:(Atlantic silverside) hypothetical protein n=1 Tax=Menidia menidia TaxID=238744 RepID=A0A8S4BSA6_9TELE|nr:unnamed protein product [Menidia menidia]